MAWMIVSDSSCEIRELENPAPGVQFALVPFKIRVGEREYVDLATLNTQQMLQAMTDYNGASTTACPSPEEWAEYFLQADNVFALTISSNLSGSYNAAQLAAEEYRQEHEGARVFVLDSLSAGPECRLLAERLAALVQGTACGITLRELKPGRVKLSLRTGPRVDASAVCRVLGGGGHKGAAGATVDGTMDEAKAAILAAYTEVMG